MTSSYATLLVYLDTISSILVIFLKTKKIKLLTCILSFNTLWDDESEILLQIKVSLKKKWSNIGLNYGYNRIFHYNKFVVRNY